MTAPRIPLIVTRGITFEFGFLYADDELSYKHITAVTQVSPVRLTVTDHGIPDGWPVRIECVNIPTELNTAEGDYVMAKVIDENTIELPNVNAYCWKPYRGGGLVVFNKPIDLTGWECRSQVRAKTGGALLFSWHSDPLQNPDGLIIIDGATITLQIDAETSEDFTWTRGVYDVEAVDPSGNVYAVVGQSTVSVVAEVTA